MKLLRLCSLVFLALLSGVRADVTIVQKVDGISQNHEMTIKVKGDKARFDVSPQVSMIVDSKSGDLISLMKDQKKFIRISSAQMKAIAEMAGKLTGKDFTNAKPNLTPTGKKEMINGYEAEEYSFQSPMLKGSYWISTSYPDAAAILKQLQAVKPEAWRTAIKGLPSYQDFPGLPLKSQSIIGNQQITTIISSIKQDTLADSEFDVPKDFQELKAPNMFGGKSPAKPDKSGDE